MRPISFLNSGDVARSGRIRLPSQLRSQLAWQRILTAGVSILEKKGREGLTIASVCRQAGVAPPAIYARVDGLSGLFWAIYEQRMKDVVATYQELLTATVATPPHSSARVGAVVRAVCLTFERHRRFLQPIINIASSDAALRARGAEHSRRLVVRVEAMLRAPGRSGTSDVARMLHQECTFRTMYGNRWLTARPESLRRFMARLTVMAQARLDFGT